MPPKDSLCDYRVYRLSGKEWVRCLLEGAAAAAVASYVFYRSVKVFLLLLPAAFLWPLVQRNTWRRRRQEELRLQFKEAIRILASSLSAGLSVENAFASGTGELKELYGSEAMITREFSYIAHQLTMNRTVEALLLDFAGRSDLEEVRQFAEIFAVSKRSRGELVSVVSHVVHVISLRIQVRQEIQAMTAEKRLEQKIMGLMPVLLVLYVDLTSPGFFSPMYETLAGRLVMTVCFLTYLAACLIAARILEVEW